MTSGSSMMQGPWTTSWRITLWTRQVINLMLHILRVRRAMDPSPRYGSINAALCDLADSGMRPDREYPRDMLVTRMWATCAATSTRCTKSRISALVAFRYSAVQMAMKVFWHYMPLNAKNYSDM